MKKSLLATAILSALVAAAGAQATTVKVSGQVSRMVIIPDDEAGDEVQFVDIGFSGSRVRFTGDHDLGNGVKAGFRFEQQFESNRSGAVNGGQTNGGDDDFLDARYQDVYFAGSFGKVSLGKGDGATNGGTESDLSGTALIATSNTQDNFGSFDLGAGVTTSDAYRQFDGLSRVNRLRYDTPRFGGGFGVAVSYGQGSATEILGSYKGKLGSTKADFRIFFADGDDFTGDTEITGLSGSILLAGGLNFTLAYSEAEDDDGDSVEGTFVKAGYKVGKHAFAIDYGMGEGDGREDGETVGVTYANHPVKGVEVFASYRSFDSDEDGTSSIDLFSLGSRVKF